MTLDPQVQHVMDVVEGWRASEGWDELATTPEGVVSLMRAVEQRRFQELTAPLVGMAEVSELVAPGPAGDVPVTAYRPSDDVVGTVVWLHGGGWVSGSVALFEDQARLLAKASDCLVLSVDYRLALEDRFPAGLEDSYAAVAWAADNLDRLGTAEKGLAIGGDSAGGNLAAAVTQLARDRGGPALDFQLLVYPSVSMSIDTESRRRFAEGYMLTGDLVDWLWTQYLDDPQDGKRPDVSPLEGRLDGLPPAAVLTAEYDILCDEGRLYAEALLRAGVAAEVVCYQGMPHGFMALSGVVDRGRDGWMDAGRILRAELLKARC
jgi:acetyl esterase